MTLFTGIVEEVGRVARLQRGRQSAVLTIAAQTVLADVHMGDSIAVGGICLTVTAFDAHSFTADVMHETLDRSALRGLQSGSLVNLERAMSANGRFGGHIVSGHVDGVGRISSVTRDDTAVWYTIQTEPAILRYIVEKGSIAIDGISLTVARVEADRFAISAIPHTVEVTTLRERRPGDLVNLEADVIGKYVEKLLQPRTNEAAQPTKSGITKELLTRYGF